MNKLFTYLLALCTATCLYGCSEELEEMTSTEESPSTLSAVQSLKVFLVER